MIKKYYYNINTYFEVKKSFFNEKKIINKLIKLMINYNSFLLFGFIIEYLKNKEFLFLGINNLNFILNLKKKNGK